MALTPLKPLRLEQWQHLMQIGSKSFVCGHCGDRVNVAVGFQTTGGSTKMHPCSGCGQVTTFQIGMPVEVQFPPPPTGRDLPNLPDAVSQMYDEARVAAGAGATTAATLALRVLLSHIAVEEGARAGDTFNQHVQHLANKNLLPPNAKPWIDHVVKRGNNVNHKLEFIERPEFDELANLAEVLLTTLYGFTAKPPAAS